jgi:hypothetical protein
MRHTDPLGGGALLPAAPPSLFFGDPEFNLEFQTHVFSGASRLNICRCQSSIDKDQLEQCRNLLFAAAFFHANVVFRISKRRIPSNQ